MSSIIAVSRTFTLDEANALVPRIIRILTRTTQMLGRVRTLQRGLSAQGVTEELDLTDRPELLAERELAQTLAAAIREEVRVLSGLGIVVRDLERGLIDFRSVLDGEREVHLCWQLGEREIRYFHDLDSGFPGRKPIEGHRFFRRRQLRAPSE